MPIGEVLDVMSSDIGNWALRESFAMLVVVNTLVSRLGSLSPARDLVALVKTPISSDAVDETITMSFKSGGNSRSLWMN